MRRDEGYAQQICADELEVCEDATSVKELFAHDPSMGYQKDEM